LLNGLEARILARPASGHDGEAITITMEGGVAKIVSGPSAVECAYQSILEVGIPLPRTGQGVQFQASFWHDGLPIDAVPVQDWVTVATVEMADWVL